MVLAAGLGSRLRPWTEKTPKALVELGGVALLERLLIRLRLAGCDAVVVNAFHLAGQVEAFLKGRDFGLRVEVSRESVLLDTGGGLKHAAAFFDDGRPLLVHNVDVHSDLDLGRFYRYHLDHPALATLAVRQRGSSRQLLFDEDGALCGHRGAKGDRWAAGRVSGARALTFDGVHVLSPDIFGLMEETGAFSINDAYLRLAGAGQRIQAFRSDDFAWHDVGTAEKLERARKLF